MAACFFGITDKGKRRDNNEDTFIVKEIAGRQLLLAAVIDGVGGYKGGEVAAGIARRVILEKVQPVSGNFTDTLQHAVVLANQKIQEQRQVNKHNANMACVLTCVIADIKNNKLSYAHVGDTRLYLLRDKSLIKISSDHSAVGFLEESGRLSEQDAMRHPRRNEIDRALGFEVAIAEAGDYIETGESPFLPGDIILLCSDGLSDMIGSDEITAILHTSKSLAAKAKDLVNAANEAGGNDNITAVLVENDKEPKKLQALKPVERKKGGSLNSANKNVADQKLIATPNNPKRTAGKHALVICVCLFLLGVLVVAFMQRKQSTNEAAAPAKQVTKDQKLIQLMAAVSDTAAQFTFSAGTSLVTRESIVISKDSFYLRGNGMHMIADTNYKGPAFIISSNAKHIVFDSMVFENFDAALLIQKSNVEFKHVHFINCRVPVQFSAAFADTLISGRFKDPIFNYTKSTKNL